MTGLPGTDARATCARSRRRVGRARGATSRPREDEEDEFAALLEAAEQGARRQRRPRSTARTTPVSRVDVARSTSTSTAAATWPGSPRRRSTRCSRCSTGADEHGASRSPSGARPGRRARPGSGPRGAGTDRSRPRCLPTCRRPRRGSSAGRRRRPGPGTAPRARTGPPVRRDLLVREDARLGEQERPGADRGDRGRAGAGRDPVDDAGVALDLVRDAAGHEQQVEVGRVVQAGVRAEHEAAARDGVGAAGVRRDHRDGQRRTARLTVEEVGSRPRRPRTDRTRRAPRPRRTPGCRPACVERRRSEDRPRGDGPRHWSAQSWVMPNSTSSRSEAVIALATSGSIACR